MRTTIDFDYRTLRQAKKAAAERGETLSSMVREAVAQYLTGADGDDAPVTDLPAGGRAGGPPLTPAELRRMLDDDDAEQVRLAGR